MTHKNTPRQCGDVAGRIGKNVIRGEAFDSLANTPDGHEKQALIALIAQLDPALVIAGGLR
jgi:hypothetical protein